MYLPQIKKQNKYLTLSLFYQDNQYANFSICHFLHTYVFTINKCIPHSDTAVLKNQVAILNLPVQGSKDAFTFR